MNQRSPGKTVLAVDDLALTWESVLVIKQVGVVGEFYSRLLVAPLHVAHQCIYTLAPLPLRRIEVLFTFRLGYWVQPLQPFQQSGFNDRLGILAGALTYLGYELDDPGIANLQRHVEPLWGLQLIPPFLPQPFGNPALG